MVKNRFDEKYDIRLAVYDEIPDVMEFIDKYWKPGHILGKNRLFFEYEMVIDNTVNFIIAKSKNDGRIEGILGFLPCSNNKEKLDIWGVIWKTVKEAMPLLGIELLKRLIIITNARTELGTGANPNTTVLILKRMHYYTAKMKHYYRLSNSGTYSIAKIVNKIIPKYNNKETINITKLKSSEELDNFFDFNTVSDVIPYKDLWYYKRRFYNHPIYKYDLWGISNNFGDKAVLTTRSQEYSSRKITRIVDYIGNQKLFSGCGKFLDYLLLDSEYVDFYFDGFNPQFAIDAGMVEIKDDDENIIPNYFYPFKQENIDIWVDSSNNVNQCLFYKADGDQDRPN